MIKIYEQLQEKKCYINEFSKENVFNESLNITEDNIFITVKNQDKFTKLKLIVFQNENAFNNYEKWASQKTLYGQKILENFHFFANKNTSQNIFFLLLLPKDEYLVKNGKNLIIEKNGKISKLLKRYRSQYLFY